MARTYLPRFYLEGFADPEGDGSSVWVYRAPIGEWKRAAAAEALAGVRLDWRKTSWVSRLRHGATSTRRR